MSIFGILVKTFEVQLISSYVGISEQNFNINLLNDGKHLMDYDGNFCNIDKNFNNFDGNPSVSGRIIIESQRLSTESL